MSAYRETRQTGLLLARCKSNGGQWLLGGVIAAIAGTPLAFASFQSVSFLVTEGFAGVILIGAAALCTLEWHRVRHHALELYEEGLLIVRADSQTWLPWPSVHSVKAIYVRGASGYGTGDRSNLVSLTLQTSHGRIVNLTDDHTTLSLVQHQLQARGHAVTCGVL